ncbi:SdrD B-like domain-containing protein [Leucobacter sp. PH1c]|uniref:SdrD B-like domain-containing protein n=1 Tax=Leucobacter sp. PH1c TaxID=1397278 RepID=UPI0004695CC5|nr:SdrD B-like domain-containing protein [Leucobacter sp. PH1c]
MPTAYPGAFVAPKRGWRGLSALLAGLLTALLVVTGLNAAPAMAAPTGTVDVQFPTGSGSWNGTPVFEEGQSYLMRVKYDNSKVPGGHEAVIVVPQGFTIGSIPAENKAVESFTLENGELRIKFKDPITVAQGVIDVNFTVDTLTESTEKEISWGVKGQEQTTTIVVKQGGDNFTTVTPATSKTSTGSTLPQARIVDGQVVLGDEFLDATISYQITVDSGAARTVSIADQLGEHLTLVPGSFGLQKTVWDAKGMNETGPTAETVEQFTGTGFSFDLDADANSKYVLTYQAKIADAQALAKLRAKLQAEYEAVEAEEGAFYGVTLGNSATVAGETHTTGTWLGGYTPVDPKPNVGSAFTKKSTVGSTRVELEADGVTLVEPKDVIYTLQADLREFNAFAGGKYALTSNVVITDILPAQLRWLGSEADFLDPTFEQVTGVSAADFGGDAYVGKYQLDGQTLRINVGKDTTQKFEIKVRAQLFSVAGLTKVANSSNQYAEIEFSKITNRATFAYGDGLTKDAETSHTPFTPKDPGSVIDDGNRFDKRAERNVIELEKGKDVAQVPFTFTVGKGLGDAAKSRVVDVIDHTALNVTEDTLADIAQTLTGRSDSGVKLDGTMFDLSLNADEHLVFQPNAAFPAEIGKDGYHFTVTIPTHKITGNTALVVKNSASYSGDDIEYEYTSTTQSKAGVAGSEIQITKTVYDPKRDGYTTNLRAEVDEDTKELIQDEFVYRVQLLPTMSFTELLYDVSDQLDSKLEFLGFVEKSDIQNGTATPADSYTIPGTQIVVTYNAAGNTLNIVSGQPVPGGEKIELFFKVKVKDYTYGEGVENVIGSSKVTITPTNEFPLDISKLDAIVPEGPAITDRDARFELRNAAGDVVLSDLYVVGGKLRLAGPNGTDLVPTVKTAGTYTIHELRAPAGYVRNNEPVELVVDSEGNSPETKFFNTPMSAVKKVSVGDYVWLDVDRDGIQGTSPDERPIEGVKLVLTGPDGKPVTDINGDPVAPVWTDANGFYEFTLLPALQDGETYTVSIDRTDDRTKQALTGLTPTEEHAGTDREQDSSSWTAVSRDDLVNDGDRDPSLDFGFFAKQVSVGDYVWLDVDRDGIQGTSPDERPIEGVKLVLTGPDGKPVTDINGDPVEPVWTDASGFYEFTQLPALEPGQKYTVSIDREDPRTQEALTGLTPTKEHAGDDRAQDSSSWTANSGDLVNDGDRDPTLDFGFQVKSYAIGDVVWIDTNKDGLQDDSEYTLADVIVRLYQEVVNDNGETEAVLVGETTTNEYGLYVFDELPAGTYRVQFELTPAQAKIYAFTKVTAGKTALDSNAGENGFSEWFVLDDTNTDLTTDYPYSDLVGGVRATQGIDPTWDAGVIVLKPVNPGPGPGPVDPTKPVKPTPGTPEAPHGGTTLGGLAVTGGSSAWGFVAGGAALLLLGAGALLLSRRRAARHG